MKTNEFVVEAMNREGRFSVIGKVLTPNNLLNDDDLEEIWDCANWEVNGREQKTIEEGIYSGMKAYFFNNMKYIIFDTRNGIVNGNIIVRKHYDVQNGYFIKSARIHKDMQCDEWSYGSSEEIMNEYKSNPFNVR